MGVDDFSEWFKGSKVVDSFGRPLIVYHGTNSSFSKFKKPSLAVGKRHFISSLGNHFTAERGIAQEFGTSRTPIEVYLSIKNPYITTEVDLYREMFEFAKEEKIFPAGFRMCEITEDGVLNAINYVQELDYRSGAFLRF